MTVLPRMLALVSFHHVCLLTVPYALAFADLILFCGQMCVYVCVKERVCEPYGNSEALKVFNVMLQRDFIELYLY